MLKTNSLCYFLGAIMTLNIYAEEFSWQNSFSSQLESNLYENKIHKEYFPFFYDLYESNNPSRIESNNKNNLIPKIIHQIWLGSPLPDKYIELQKTWKQHHPDWEYKLWTEEELSTFNLKNRTAFDEAANYGEKANIWRYEILERFGGLYVDTDFECLKPLDELMENYEFFAGMSSLKRRELICNAIIACIPNHPIIKNCVKNTNKLVWDEKIGKHPQFYRNGIFFFERTIYETAIKLEKDVLKKVIILPPSVFFPNPGDKNELSKNLSYAIHYFDSQWMEKKKK